MRRLPRPTLRAPTRLPAALALALLALLMGAPAAVADEEPSELLAYLNVVGPTPPPSPGVALRLRQATERAQKAGVPVKVALVRTDHDLEEVEHYMGRPTDYAKALGRAISYYFEGQVVVAMPSGLGTAGPLPREVVRKALAGVRVDRPAGSDDLARAATSAVNRLVREAAAVTVPASGSGWLVPGLGLAGAAAASVGAGALLARRRRA